MKKTVLLFSALLVVGTFAMAQTLQTREGVIYFNPNKNQSSKEYASESKQATARLNAETGDVALLVPMKSFHFN
ncbi:MAG TPA: hypothetical protein VK907_11800, partial [Phnomibacter sp.]|nr:hypothetical protein [Phnomibacter sp.]